MCLEEGETGLAAGVSLEFRNDALSGSSFWLSMSVGLELRASDVNSAISFHFHA